MVTIKLNLQRLNMKIEYTSDESYSNENSIITNFKPSTITEIKSFDLQKNDKCKIEVITQCPFTLEKNLDTKNTVVADIDIIFEDSSFNNCFLFVDDYGKDVYIPFESVKIINKSSKAQKWKIV